jgi:hypothetical protein
MKAILKKPWQSPRGKLYPVGTTFVKNNIQVISGLNASWYDFHMPNDSYGFVLIPDSVFKRLTPEEVYIRELRQKKRDAHIRATADPFLRKFSNYQDDDD